MAKQQFRWSHKKKRLETGKKYKNISILKTQAKFSVEKASLFPASYFVNINKLTLKSAQRGKRPSRARKVKEKEKKAEVLTWAESSQCGAGGRQDRSLEQKRKPRNRPWTNTVNWTELWQRNKGKQWGKEAFNRWCWRNWTPMCKLKKKI